MLGLRRASRSHENDVSLIMFHLNDRAMDAVCFMWVFLGIRLLVQISLMISRSVSGVWTAFVLPLALPLSGVKTKT